MTTENHASRKAAVYEAALQLIAGGVSPANMKIQQLADAAGIGKGTVYEYFSSKEEILQGLAVYCFTRENERIRALFADCTTLDGLVERIVAYLRDIAANRMGSYRMIAESLGMPDCDKTMPDCAGELKEITTALIERLQAAGEIDPALSVKYCCTAMLSAVVTGLMGLYYAAEHHRDEAELIENLKVMLHRTMKTQ